MQKNILLPQVELTMESVQVIGWLVKVGDQVQADQPIVEVESQKGVVEVPSPEAGIVRKLCVNKGDTIGEKALLCVLTDSVDEPISEAVAAVVDRGGSEGPRSPSTATTEAESGLIKAAPAARKLAKDRGIDLTTIKGTGPGGRITLADVGAASPPRPGSTDWTPLPAARRALIQQMQKSLAEIPQFHVARQMDVAALVVGRVPSRGDSASPKTPAEGSGPTTELKITFTHRLVRAVAHTLAKHPVLRTIINGDKTRVLPVSVAVAMDTPHGLVAPAVRQADQLSLEQIAVQVKELRVRAEAGKSRREDLTDAPFAISNLGMLGIDFFAPFVFHGQTAVLAIGRAVDGKAWFTLGVDHRVVDGAEAARFLETLQQEITKV